jgi:hypothetical protein
MGRDLNKVTEDRITAAIKLADTANSIAPSARHKVHPGSEHGKGEDGSKVLKPGRPLDMETRFRMKERRSVCLED